MRERKPGERIKRNSRKTYWYLTNFDAKTNEIISTRISDENRLSQALCQDGEKRDLWITDYKTITELKRAKDKFGLVFTVYKRDGDGGPIRKYDFPKKKTSLSEKELQKWLERLKERRNKKS